MRFILSITILGLCAICCGDDDVKSSEDLGIYEGRGGPPPSGCPYDCNYACHVCSGGTAGYDYQVACLRENDCRVFCGPVAKGFQICEGYTGEPGTECSIQFERGTIFGCSQFECEYPSSIGQPSGGCWVCPFCFISGQMVTDVEGPDGKIYRFTNTCIPRSFEDCMK